ncbi:hypothetical protein VFPPC_17977 [Pochonia chlamydosporia 170]|uniref:Uncharacterized protein n=1 Tax=Pochonia chlamydosporia 170 TaxID=1380566 RepID=A0A219APT8_METCM|nr:hypothetical protein VFPPC_17977 [Pochonia chlamydosporia 170]OWT42830.1 hypothetical protein VFPPC_17977 [Pochonia chlamydosporia 170]
MMSRPHRHGPSSGTLWVVAWSESASCGPIFRQARRSANVRLRAKTACLCWNCSCW